MMAGCFFGGPDRSTHFCAGNNANNQQPNTMSTISKHLSFIAALDAAGDTVQRSGRISIEQKYAPHYRTFVLVGRDISREQLNSIDDVAVAHGLNMNPFRAGTDVTSITFTDREEQAR